MPTDVGQALSPARSLCLLTVALALSSPLACRRAPEPAPQKAAAAVGQTPAGQAPQFATIVHMGDPRSAGQLLAGFYGIEAGSWRWTGKQFTVELGTPYGAASKGASLELNFTIPPVVIQKSKSVTLSASAADSPLPPETYSAPGAYTYRRDIPAAAFAHDSVKVIFTLDKSFSPGGGDLRDLGVVTSAVALK
jgi:hypothetical protein